MLKGQVEIGSRAGKGKIGSAKLFGVFGPDGFLEM